MSEIDASLGQTHNLSGRSYTVVNIAQHTEEKRQFLVYSVPDHDFLLRSLDLADNRISIPPVSRNNIALTIWQHYKFTAEEPMTYTKRLKISNKILCLLYTRRDSFPFGTENQSFVDFQVYKGLKFIRKFMSFGIYCSRFGNKSGWLGSICVILSSLSKRI